MRDKLERYRRKIDAIDVAMIKLLTNRANTVVRIGKAKKKMGIEVHQEVRWQEVMKRVKELAKRSKVLDENYVEDIWNRIHEESKKMESDNK